MIFRMRSMQIRNKDPCEHSGESLHVMMWIALFWVLYFFYSIKTVKPIPCYHRPTMGELVHKVLTVCFPHIFMLFPIVNEELYYIMPRPVSRSRSRVNWAEYGPSRAEPSRAGIYASRSRKSCEPSRAEPSRNILYFFSCKTSAWLFLKLYAGRPQIFTDFMWIMNHCDFIIVCNLSLYPTTNSNFYVNTSLPSHDVTSAGGSPHRTRAALRH